ncbi:CpsD/CapB family tyrosine-protein kinase [Bacillus carboniphilus]|uniref:non-specific protein-tyrosine kinase n=1 Tax=Bacillus carboniphilus TaxID=86663 RepID=A0ABY9JT27_9BACI|nr:CpsD/CapB family tyrosine-protein kinase [Bacillus carboniphilus]WLR41580.1 CpsD/CapB family tyrosine-protein kinase [Bacillus carboniphilus]
MFKRKKGPRHFRHNNRSLVTLRTPKSPVSEQFRTIRTNIDFSSIDEEIRSILVTSTGPGEGKSTVAANLACVYAQQGKKVLLVDSDLRKSTVHYTFRVENLYGLTSVLLKQVPMEKAIQDCEQDRLHILTGGPTPPNPAELLSSKAMFELIESVKEHYDIVIIDAPPILAVADARIIANHVDGTLLVVSSGKTDKDQAVKAKEALEQSRSKLLGAVLNGKKHDDQHLYYYYG